MRNTLESYRYQIEQNGFTFEEKIDDNVPPMKVDREAMARSLLNLVNNALKYSQDRKYIGVNLYRQNEFREAGSGGPRHWHSARRAVRRSSRSFTGSAIRWCTTPKAAGWACRWCATLCRAHGGEVAVDSEPGRGSTFIITLPVNPTGNGERATA